MKTMKIQVKSMKIINEYAYKNGKKFRLKGDFDIWFYENAFWKRFHDCKAKMGVYRMGASRRKEAKWKEGANMIYNYYDEEDVKEEVVEDDDTTINSLIASMYTKMSVNSTIAGGSIVPQED